MRRTIIGVLLAWASACASALDVPLAWDASTSPDVAGYRIHVGTQSGVYTQMHDAGLALSYTVNGLADDQDYYFAATAYDATQQSGFSNETIYLAQGSPAITPLDQINVSVTKQLQDTAMAAEVIGTPVAIALGTSATPGAQNVTVPSDAQGVVIFMTAWRNANQALLTSIANNFTAANLTISQVNITTAGFAGTAIAYGVVTSTGAKTFTPVFPAANSEGPTTIVAFVKGIDTSDWIRATAFDQGTNSAAVAAAVASVSDDLVLAADQRYNEAGTPASNETGWTSLQTQANNFETVRLRSADTPGASTTTANGQDEYYSSISIVSIKSGGAATVSDPPSNFRRHPMRFLGVR